MKKIKTASILGIILSIFITTPVMAAPEYKLADEASSEDVITSDIYASDVEIDELSKEDYSIYYDDIYQNEDINIKIEGRSFEYISSEEFNELCHIVEAEAGNQPIRCRVAVCDCILNRVESYKFPNDIHGVIYAPGQFEPVSNGSIRKTPAEKTKIAVCIALKHRYLEPTVCYFNSINFFSWVPKYKKIDAMYFSYQ